jgi:hypothetical protein
MYFFLLSLVGRMKKIWFGDHFKNRENLILVPNKLKMSAEADFEGNFGTIRLDNLKKKKNTSTCTRTRNLNRIFV